MPMANKDLYRGRKARRGGRGGEVASLCVSGGERNRGRGNGQSAIIDLPCGGWSSGGLLELLWVPVAGASRMLSKGCGRLGMVDGGGPCANRNEYRISLRWRGIAVEDGLLIKGNGCYCM